MLFFSVVKPIGLLVEMHWKSEQKVECCDVVDKNENGCMLMSSNGVSDLSTLYWNHRRPTLKWKCCNRSYYYCSYFNIIQSTWVIWKLQHDCRSWNIEPVKMGPNYFPNYTLHPLKIITKQWGVFSQFQEMSKMNCPLAKYSAIKTQVVNENSSPFGCPGQTFKTNLVF